MKKILTVALLVVALLGPSSTPASAIFGLSACEKAGKAIKAEEKIGVESWKYYRKLVKTYNRDSNWNGYLVDAILEVYKSDETVWGIGIKNAKCFTPAQNAQIRRQLSNTKKVMAHYRSLVKNENFQYQTYDWSIYYKDYLSFVYLINLTSK